MTKTEYMREWRARHPEYRDYMRRWREAHAEHLSQYRKARYFEHREIEITLATIYQQEHIIEAAIYRKVNAANKRYPGRINANDVRTVIERNGWQCCWCKKPIERWRDFTLEHLKPVNDPNYLAIACLACNAAKLHKSGRTRRLTLEERKQRAHELRPAYDKKWKLKHREQENAGQRARYWAKVDERRAYFREWQRRKRERDQNSH